MYGGIKLNQDPKIRLARQGKNAKHRSRSHWPNCYGSTANERVREGDELPTRKWHDPLTGEMDLILMKATDMPFNKRITIPEPMKNETEIPMQGMNTN